MTEGEGGKRKRRFLIAAVIIVVSAVAMLAAWKVAVAVRDSARRAIAGMKQTRDSFDPHFQRYRRSMPHKALAFAFDSPESRWAWGWHAGSVTLQDAVRMAHESCDKTRVKERISAPCRLYAVDDTVVVDFTNAALKELLGRYRSMREEGGS